MFCPLPESRSRSRPWQRLLWPVLALAAMVMMGHLVRSQLSLRDTIAGGEKFEYYLQHRAEYNLVFVGNSMIYRGVIPPLFDARMAERGFATRSFNLGFGGVRQAETDLLVRHLLRTGDPPEHMIMGRVSSSARIRGWDRRTWRGVAWHTPRHTLTALRVTRLLKAPLDERLRLAGSHVRLLGQWLTTFGGGPRILRSWLRPTPTDSSLNKWAASGGHQDLEGLPGRTVHQRRRRFLKRIQRYLDTLERNRDRPRRSVSAATATNLRNLARLATDVAAAGAAPVLLVSPKDGGFASLDPAFAAGTPLLNFDRPALYPELFDPDMRFDSVHLSRAGAEAYTLLLADAFADLLLSRSKGGSG